MSVLVTGSQGFIGSAVCEALLSRGERVVAIDRVASPFIGDNLVRLGLDIADPASLANIMDDYGVDRVIHLAAKAGVRGNDAHAYGHSNLLGHLSILDDCRKVGARLVYASSSSVYGTPLTSGPTPESAPCNPRSIYAATKLSGEIMANTYCELHGLQATGLRFFSVYGPAGRDDMAPMIFAKAVRDQRPITIYGKCTRDFTFIGDVVSAILLCLDNPAQGHRVLNVGSGEPHTIEALATCLMGVMGRSVPVECAPGRPEDTPATWADNSRLRNLGWKPTTGLEEGLRKMVEWMEAA